MIVMFTSDVDWLVNATEEEVQVLQVAILITLGCTPRAWKAVTNPVEVFDRGRLHRDEKRLLEILISHASRCNLDPHDLPEPTLPSTLRRVVLARRK